ncbi:hypothetical protein AVEN_93980-1 [Araneus ventricosus]|uniref:Uncharacterized protein n=1 Tax=Araneus ventricosus TaxID=182803 RepID=A0A4Y2CK92_ARAVE|nr:hypothetical protein AVEN_93980-1 [Araneus ventricosus]
MYIFMCMHYCPTGEHHDYVDGKPPHNSAIFPGFRDELRGAGSRGHKHHLDMSGQGPPDPHYHVEEGRWTGTNE